MNDMLDSLTVEKVKTFIKACKYVKTMLNEGASREQVGEMVSLFIFLWH